MRPNNNFEAIPELTLIVGQPFDNKPGDPEQDQPVSGRPTFYLFISGILPFEVLSPKCADLSSSGEICAAGGHLSCLRSAWTRLMLLLSVVRKYSFVQVFQMAGKKPAAGAKAQTATPKAAPSAKKQVATPAPKATEGASAKATPTAKPAKAPKKAV
ncbi:hypothetical protein CVT24_005897 [Panaeolus cyanescens]|uniref:Uncharacterized protein n=1 Tax=Panaeolus cyanescens TaxID=181874 RepID=A0A409WVG4_9AGAR|nr:hypothetical protein CVT24_005897 [Panaeolus cyanescens]